MLFHSTLFLLVFLPIALAGWYSASERRDARLAWLILASAAFYAAWDWRFLPLLIGLAVLTWVCGRLMRLGSSRRAVRHWAAVGIAANLGALAFFKYSDFLLSNLAALAGAVHAPIAATLPLGISFSSFRRSRTSSTCAGQTTLPATASATFCCSSCSFRSSLLARSCDTTS